MSKSKVADSKSDDLSKQMSKMHSEGYRVLPDTVFPSALIDGDDDTLASLNDVMNFTHLGVRRTAGWGYGTDKDNFGRIGGVAGMCPGGFTSVGNEIVVSDTGTEGRGYIQWGANNQLPNWIALAANVLTYTATGLKFNTDVACGLGMVPMYRYYSNAGGNDNEVNIPFAAAGAMIKKRIIDLQNKIFQLTKDYINQAPVNDNENQNDNYNDNENDNDNKGLTIVDDEPTPNSSLLTPNLEDENENENENETRPLRNADGTYFKRIADDMLDDMVSEYREQIGELKADYKRWKSTNAAIKEFLKRTNINNLNQKILTDLMFFGNAYPEIELSQEGAKQPLNSQWKPKVVGLGHWSALESRKERMNENGVSRYIYLSKKWINPQDATVSDKITSLPAIDTLHPVKDLEAQIRKFRMSSAPDDKNLWARPTRFIMPLSYYTPGRPYYAQPAWWAVFNDIYQFASNIIRDRAIRKRNENTFGRIVYVHSDYLEKLTTQINAQKTDEEKEQIKQREIMKIKNFLSNKFNNGQTFAACTFTGNDGKDHDAFRVETIPYNTKNVAEADKTEIADASGIIMFALECHPDLIGSTPGGSSSKGGTYQREMLQIKEYKLAPTQEILISLYNTVKEINKWDEHLNWHICQRSLTTLDRNHSGELDD